MCTLECIYMFYVLYHKLLPPRPLSPPPPPPSALCQEARELDNQARTNPNVPWPPVQTQYVTVRSSVSSSNLILRIRNPLRRM